MKHLISSAIAVTFSLLSSSALATSEPAACSMPSGEATALLRDRSDVPLDARLIFAWDPTCSGEDSVLVYGARGDLVVARQWIHRSDFDVFEPSQLLDPDTTYRVVFTKNLQPMDELHFSTGHTVLGARQLPMPSIASHGFTWTGEDTGSVELSVAQGGAEPLGVYEVHVVGGRDRSIFAKGQDEVHFSEPIDTPPGKETCFEVSYWSANGQRTPYSQRACITPTRAAGTGTRAAFEDDIIRDDESAFSCSASPTRSAHAGAGLGAFAAIGLALGAVTARRRRVR